MSFNFRFKTLLKVRKIKENIAQQAFSQVQRHRLNIQNLKDLKVTTRNETIRELTSRMKSGISALRMRQYHEYITFLEDSIKQLDKNLASVDKQLDMRRLEMLKAKKEHKAIERLKELDEKDYTIKQRKAEMRFIDEIAILRHGENL
ncbi:MAG TPA: flagellar export protein FliJ [Deltaproteobacteria bacterium]|nr:flagellar export protein FliJ [Deltaproteobacteria bacterium]